MERGPFTDDDLPVNFSMLTSQRLVPADNMVYELYLSWLCSDHFYDCKYLVTQYQQVGNFAVVGNKPKMGVYEPQFFFKKKNNLQGIYCEIEFYDLLALASWTKSMWKQRAGIPDFVYYFMGKTKLSIITVSIIKSY